MNPPQLLLAAHSFWQLSLKWVEKRLSSVQSLPVYAVNETSAIQQNEHSGFDQASNFVN